MCALQLFYGDEYNSSHKLIEVILCKSVEYVASLLASVRELTEMLIETRAIN
jgi:hypothetical protein